MTIKPNGQVARNEIQITKLLTDTKRKGMKSMLQWLHDHHFFTQPASTKHHGCYAGGLAQHSLNVYKLVQQSNRIYQLGEDDHSIAIACLLHDVCKAGAYLGDKKPYRWNKKHPKGHASLSLKIIKKRIELEEVEELMIKFHMGVYGLVEFDQRKGEYHLRSIDLPDGTKEPGMANAWFHHPIVKVIYFCDEFATLSEKAEEIE